MTKLKWLVCCASLVIAGRTLGVGADAPVPTVATGGGGRLQADNLVPVGTFRLPQETLGSKAGFGSNTGCCGLGAYGMAFNAARNSIYIGGHPYEQRLAEIAIPASFAGNPVATALSNLVDPLDGKLDAINPDDPNQKVIGAAIVYDKSLYVAGFSFYDGAGTQSKSWFKRPLDLTVAGQLRGPSQVGTMYQGWIDRSATLVPPEWQAALGGPALFGGGGGSINALQSWGPSLAVVDPANIGGTGRAPAVILLGYPFPKHELSPNETAANPVWSQMDVVTGVVFVPGSSSVLFFGRHGQGNFCYGPVTGDPSKVGKPAVDIGDTADNYCWDPDNRSKGGHAYPYASWVWAYDANDLAAVRRGKRNFYDVKPYATWNLDPSFIDIQGVAYDPATSRLFVSQVAGDPFNSGQPLIHVLEVRQSVAGLSRAE